MWGRTVVENVLDGVGSGLGDVGNARICVDAHNRIEFHFEKSL